MPRPNYRPRVLWLGDSLTWGFDASPAAGPRSSAFFKLAPVAPFFGIGDPSFANGGSGTPSGVLAVDPFNDGVNGATIVVIVADCQNDMSSQLSPDICVLEGGTNNITVGQDANTILNTWWSYYLDIAAAFMEHSWKRIVVQGIIKRIDDPGNRAIAEAVNAGLPALIASKPYASIVDYSPISIANVIPDADYSVDGIHFTQPGADIYGNALAPLLLPSIRKVQASTALG